MTNPYTKPDGSLRDPLPDEITFTKRWVENGGNAIQAVRDTFPDLSPTSTRTTALRLSRQNPVVRQLMLDALEAAGLTVDALAKTIQRAVTAKRVVFPLGNPEGVVTEHDDHKVQLAGADMALKLMDAYPDKAPPEPTNGGQHLHLHYDEPVEITRFIVLNGRHPTDTERNALLGKSIIVDVTEKSDD